MTERIKNFKIFQKTFAIVFVVGVLITLFFLYNSPNNYHVNKDKYDYTVDIAYDAVTVDRVLAGEEVYLSEEEYLLYKKTIPLRLIKKINKLAYLDNEIEEAYDFYEAKYSDEIALSNDPSRYKLAKTEIINSYLSDKLKDEKYLLASNVYLLASKDDFDYIKEVVFFIDAESFNIEASIEINSKYNHKEDSLKYASFDEISLDKIEKANFILCSSMAMYNRINDTKEAIVKNSVGNKSKVSQMFIYDVENVILYKDDSSTVKVNALNFNIEQ